MFEYYAIRIYCEDCLGDNMGMLSFIREKS